jgi:hypothetical protein
MNTAAAPTKAPASGPVKSLWPPALPVGGGLRARQTIMLEKDVEITNVELPEGDVPGVLEGSELVLEGLDALDAGLEALNPMTVELIQDINDGPLPGKDVVWMSKACQPG